MIIYAGPSLINGDPIVAIATGYVRPTANSKTGPMVQVWILPTKSHPLDAMRNGDDVAVCGSCPLRKATAEPGDIHCYVRGHPILSITKTFLRGGYASGSPEALLEASAMRLALRFGAYGEPTAVPYEVWAPLIAATGRSWTGYTHRWREVPADPWATCLMASVETQEAADEAHALGWRTFRVRQAHEAPNGLVTVDPLARDEVICPASTEGGYRKHCADCGLCNGVRPGARRKSVAIIDHGTHRALRLRDRALGLKPTQLKLSALVAP